MRVAPGHPAERVAAVILDLPLVRMVRADGDFDSLAPGEILEGIRDVGGTARVIACPKCGKVIGLPHAVEVHEDGTVTLWNPAGVGIGPRSLKCPLCGLHVHVDRGRCSSG